ncbi:bifunctional alpha,alpha-trehalose-phosphate synthase (UDP-forming)/trehalose-phosphatase [Myceligenerans crystallogenes]|uniref:Bifunctional alpha,alpha-trehalose-phosphate synthase (UDP-forming)/trehalose-phosphatase n=1 Tax=Myceligenerans crystallogenes TaxID=316335 RepID=A0ABN2NA00_9MICO
MVANRLPVDFSVSPTGELSWQRSPGGLVTALEPVMQQADGAWIGWSGAPDLAHEPFDAEGMRLVPVTLSAQEIERYYEGFSNDTLWPLYHDVIAPPTYHRQWWDSYRRVNQRFAQAAADHAAHGATVWVHDYQLQLVPRMLRDLRPDLRIGFFDHIPFPPVELFGQLPWRRQIVDGLLGADVIGFQRNGDAANFVRAVRRLTDYTTRGPVITMPDAEGRPGRHVRAQAFPISIDSHRFDMLARTPEVQARAKEIRRDLGDPDIVYLGVDRLDYTKGIRHRIKAYGELLEDGRLDVTRATLVQVASPSRENVGAYQELREHVEILVGRVNGEFGELGHSAIHYLHHSYPAEEMAALYLTADVMLVTALRDGMNLVAKEYVAARSDEKGVLVLSEFTGAADELSPGPLLVNPHDIDGMKDIIVAASTMDEKEQRRRMRRLRRKIMTDDVAKWSESFLSVLAAVQPRPTDEPRHEPTGTLAESLHTFASIPPGRRRRRNAEPAVAWLIASDFDGTLSRLVDDPKASRMTEGSRVAADRIAALADEAPVRFALVSGRDLKSLAEVAEAPVGSFLVGSHGAETGRQTDRGIQSVPLQLSPAQHTQLDALVAGFEAAAADREGVWVEVKPGAAVLHTRLAGTDDAAAVTVAADEVASNLGLAPMHGKDVVEVSVVSTSKGEALRQLRDVVAAETGAQTVRIFYSGDDTTDEHAFAALEAGDLAVKVGTGDSLAPHRVPDADTLAVVLERLADELSGDEIND